MPSLLPEFLRDPPYRRLYYHVTRNDLQKVKKYIAEGVDADFTLQPEGISPLLYATSRGYTDIVRILVTPKAEGGGGVDVNRGSVYGTDTEVEGFTALMTACVKGNLEIAKLLLENGADPNIMNKNGKKAIHYTRDPEIKILLEGHPPADTATVEPTGGRRRRHRTRNRRSRRLHTRNKRRSTAQSH